MSRKRIVIGAVLAIVGLLIAGEILAGFLRLDRQRAIIERKLSEAAGLDVSIGGDLELHLFPDPRSEAKSVTVANLPNRPSPHLLAIDSVDLAFDSWKLLFGAVEIDHLELVGLEVHIETDAQDQFPVPHRVDSLLDEEVSGPVDLRIRRFDAEDARIFLLDGESGRLTTLLVSELSLAAEDSDAPIALLARGEIDGASFDLRGSAGPLPELLRPTAPYPISLAGRLLEIEIEAAGTVAAPLDLDGLDVQMRLRARDLTVVGDALALTAKLPPIGPVDAAGRLRDRDGALALEEISVQIGSHETARVEIRGSVADTAGFRGVGLHTTIHAADSRHLLAHLDREIPDIGPVHASAHVNDRDGSLGIEDVSVRGGHTGIFELDLTGSFDHVREIDEIEFEARLAASDLAVIGSLLGADLPAIGPVAFTGRVAGSDEAIHSSGVLRLDKTSFSGEWSGSFVPEDRPHLTARIDSPHVHLDDIGIEPHPDAAEPSREGGAAPARRPAGSEPLPFDQLRAVDLDLTIRAERVSGRAGFELTDVRTSIGLSDGELTIRDSSAEYEAGSVKAFLHADASTPVPSIAFRGDVRGVDLTRLMSQFQQETGYIGHVDLGVALESRGRTLGAILSQLEGRVEVLLRDGNLASRYGSKFVKEVARVSVPNFLPRAQTAVDCFVAAFAIDEGMAHVEMLRLGAPRVVVTGAGRVDLAHDAYSLRLTPKPRDPSLFSVAVMVDVTGPLADPNFTPVPRTLATSAARAVVSNALKPAGALLRPLQRGGSAAPGDGCDWEPFAPDFR